MPVTIREGRASDAAECGRICYEAFSAIAKEHNFIPDFPSVEAATGLATFALGDPGTYGVVAENDGKIVGSNFLIERDPIAGVGPVTVDPAAQNEGVGASLMRAVLNRAAAKGAVGVRLVQAGYHCRSLSLYSKFGFDVREHLSCMQGSAIKQKLPGYSVRVATEGDLEACNTLAIRVHGHHRSGELRAAISRKNASVVERLGRITGYATQIAFFGHVVAETNDDLKALIGGAEAYAGPGFLVPSRNGELLRWCLEKGLRVTQPLTLMALGLYAEPKGAWLPSILY